MTQTIEALAGTGRLVGCTGYCQPRGRAQRIGGPRNPDLLKIKRLKPDLIVASREENRREDIAWLGEIAVVLVTEVRSVDGARRLAETLGAILGVPEKGRALGRAIAKTRKALRRASQPVAPVPLVCLIWRKPWMLVGRGTYADSLIAAAGGKNLGRRFGARYPAFDPRRLRKLQPEICLLPSEPHDWKPRQAAELRKKYLPERCRIVRIDGAALFWLPGRTADGLAVLAQALRKGETR